MEGNVSVYQVNPVSRITGEGTAEFLRTPGADFDQKEGREGTGWAALFVRVNIISFWWGMRGGMWRGRRGRA